MSRATKRDMVERMDSIQEALGTGEKLNDMVKRLAHKHGCSEMSIRRQYREIMDDIQTRTESEREDLRVKLQLELESIKALALSKSQYKSAMDAINLQAKISGIYNPQKVEKEEVEKKTPVFIFEEVDNSAALNIVEDDEEKAANE